MGWIHDTGYRPAYEHEGYSVTVLVDGRETSHVSAALEPSVIGWRAACDCGWRGVQFYPRAEWPSRNGAPPSDVEGWETGGGIFGDWSHHLGRALPELAIFDHARALRVAQLQISEAVYAARRAGVTWVRIGAAAGITSEQASQRWATATPPDLSGKPVVRR